MADDDETIRQLFAQIRAFGWHEAKREMNFRVHKIDFEDVKGIFDGPVLIRRSDRHGEVRYQIFGYADGREVAIACTIRGQVCWIISARRARKDERRKYYSGRMGRPPEGQN